MPGSRTRVAAAVTIALAFTLVPSSSSAETDLSGRWVSDSLRDNRIGYYLVLRDAPGRAVGYVGHLRFERQDGSREGRVPVIVTLAGRDVVITARTGTFDRSGRTLVGRIDGQGGLVLTNCLDRLRLVMSWDLASDCTLRLQG